MKAFNLGMRSGFARLPFIFSIALLLAVFTSCTSNEPGIHDVEVGEKNNGEGYLGTSMPVKASINFGEEKLSSLTLGMSSADGASSFEMDLTPRYAGQSNVNLVEDFIFPEGTEAGEYVLTLNTKGSSGTIYKNERKFHILVDSSLPVIDEFEVGINAKGNDLHLAAHIAAPKKIEKVILQITGLEWTKEFVFNKASVKDQTAIHFHEHAHVDEAPAGEYEVILTVEDQGGRKATANGKFEKK